jgi:hypothetical protein
MRLFEMLPVLMLICILIWGAGCMSQPAPAVKATPAAKCCPCGPGCDCGSGCKCPCDCCKKK